MPMTVVVTRDVPDRFRGFLASCMVEIAPGVYTSPSMTRGVRTRVWSVLTEWFGELGGSSIVMTWHDPTLPARQGIACLGMPAKTLIDDDGVLLVRREIAKK